MAELSTNAEAVGLTPGERPRLRRGRTWLALALLALPFAEIVWLSLAFDTPNLDSVPGWVRAIVLQSPAIARVTLAVIAAMCLVGATGFRDRLREVAGYVDQPHPWRFPMLAAQLCVFAGFVWLTGALFRAEGAPEASVPLVVAWLATGAAVLVAWMGAVLTPGAWRGLLHRGLWPVVIGVATGVAAWALGRLTQTLWLPLADWTLELVHGILRLTGDVVCDPSERLVGTSAFAVSIKAGCSGWEGIGLIWAFLGFYLWACRRSLRFPAALLLFPMGTVVMWLANAVRITCLIFVGAKISPAVAVGGFHSQAGWLMFIAVALGSIALSTRLGMFSREGRRAEASAGTNAAVAFLAPFAAILAATMVTAAVRGAGDLDTLYPLRVAAAAAALWGFRKTYSGLNWSCSWQAVALGLLAAVAWIAAAPVGLDGGSAAPPPAALAKLSTPAACCWLFLRLSGYVLTVPLAEELAFRGYLTRRLISADVEATALGRFSWPSFLVSSALFGALHGRLWLGGALAGMLYAISLYRRRSLGDAVAAHATTNAAVFAYSFWSGNWSLWS